MLPDRVSNPGPLTYESGALPIASLCIKCPEYVNHLCVIQQFSLFQNNMPKYLDPSCKLDLDFLDCLEGRNVISFYGK